jgi:hypothetical protein
MRIAPRCAIFLPATLAIVMVGTGCNTTNKPAPPKPGTIAHSWMVEEEAYKAGDYKRANEQLTKLASTRSEYMDRARLRSFIITSGVVNGYREMADAYDAAARTNRALTSDYRKRMSDARRAASQSVMMMVQNLHDFIKESKDGKVAFDFDFPSGKSAEPLQLARLKKGLPLQPSDHSVLEKAMLERGVVLVAADVAGAPGDPEKAKSQFQQPPKESFLLAMARVLHDSADLYGPNKLDEPRRMHVLCTEALSALATVPAGPDRKQIEAKIRELMKKHPLKEG